MRQGDRSTVEARATAAPLPVPALRPAPPVASLLRDRMAFLRGFIQHPDQVGSVIPSSGWLEQRLVRAAGIAGTQTVVELGPGTGGTTRAFLRALPTSGRLMAIELSPAFHARVSAGIADPRFTAQLGSAEQLAEYIAARRLPAPEAIVSGIPFSTMPAEVAHRIAAAVVSSLAPGGRFVAYQVRAHVTGYLTPLLGPPVAQWEWLNVPPVRVFTWRKPS